MIRILLADKDPSVVQRFRHILSDENASTRYKIQVKGLLSELQGVINDDKVFPSIEMVICQNESDVISNIKTSLISDHRFSVVFIGLCQRSEENKITLIEQILQIDPFIEIVWMIDPSDINSLPSLERIPHAHKLQIVEKPLHEKEIQQLTYILISKWLVEKAFIKIQSELEKRVCERTDALKKERNFIAAVLDTAGALLIVLDDMGRVVKFNRACEELTGYRHLNIQGKYFWELFGISQEAESIRNGFDRIKVTHQPQTFETYWTTAHGNRRLIKWSVSPMSDEQAFVEYWIWSGLDITDRNRMEEELRASEEGYRALIENVKDGVALIQREKLIFANDSFLSMFGFKSLDELMGKKITGLVDKAFEDKFKQFINTTLDHKSWGVAFRGKCKKQSGEEFWAETFSSVIPYKGVTTILLTVRDITENMLWEQTMKQEAEYFRSETVRLKSSIGERYRLGNIIGKSPAMQKVYELILQAASTDANVVIFGKSGTGKELVAKAIHDMSSRSERNFVPVNCGAIPDTLIESEFFGYKKGAFTGATTDKHGFLHEANHGTLFLDEIGDIPLSMQVKLLRVIEGGSFIPLGDNKQHKANVRIIAAMNKDPIEMVKKGLMREDFFYRISVIPITMPALKDRKEDIPLLVDHFLKMFNSEIKTLPVNVMNALMNYDWPGNVRELQNVLQRYVTVKSLDFMTIALNDPSISASPSISTIETPDGQDIQSILDRYEKQLLLQTLEKYRWNKTHTAQALGISRRSLFRRMKRLGI